jgi:hypothetical protein
MLAVTFLMLCCGSPAWGQVKATLTPAPQQRAGDAPYRSAELALENDSAATIDAVVLDPVGGGPAMRYALVVPPGKSAAATVLLPALWPAQQYDLTAADAAGHTVAKTSTSITWPGDLVTTDSFIDDTFRNWDAPTMLSQAQPRRNVLLLLAGLTVALAGALFIPRPMLRAAVVVALAGASLLALPNIRLWPAAIVSTDYQITMYAHGTLATTDSFSAVAALRTADARLTWPGSSGFQLGSAKVIAPCCQAQVPYPIYADRQAAAARDCQVDPQAMTISMTVAPRQLWIIRPAKSSSALPALTAEGTFRRDPDGIVHVAANFPHRRALVVYNQRLAEVPAGAGAFEADTAKAIPGGITGDPRLDDDCVRLLAYWRDKYFQAGKAYVVNFPAGPDCRMEVLELDEAAPATTSAPQNTTSIE